MRVRTVLAVLVVIGGCYLAWRALHGEPIARCLDQGGCWVYGEERCEHSDQTACDRSRALRDAKSIPHP